MIKGEIFNVFYPGVLEDSLLPRCQFFPTQSIDSHGECNVKNSYSVTSQRTSKIMANYQKLEERFT